jgi:hypothetical protein
VGGGLHFSFGAHDQDRTGDLILTKDVLYQLSYVGHREKKNLSLKGTTGWPDIDARQASRVSFK